MNAGQATSCHRAALLAAALVAAAGALPVRAQAPPSAPAPVIRDIEVRYLDAAPPGDPGLVLSLTSARVGRPATQDLLSRDQRALLDAGGFADARVLLEPCDDGVRVIYEVRRRLRFAAPARIRGATALSEKRVRQALGLQDGDFIDAAILANRAARVREEYRKRHYPDARIKATLETDEAGGQAQVILDIDEGPRRVIGGFRFEGNRAISDAELRAALGQPSPYNPFGFFYRRWRTRAGDFEAVRDTVRELYLDRGYLDVKVAPPRLEARPGRDSVMVVTIEEGDLYRVAEVTISGVTLFPLAELEREIHPLLRPGDVAARSALRQAAQALRDYYGRRGYVDTTVRPQTVAAADRPLVNVRFDIREGELARVRNIFIRGNTRTKDKVIRREIGLAPGEILDEVQAERNRRRLENLGYFETVRYYETPAADDPSQRDVTYEVAEKNTGQFMVGAGFSSVDDLIGFVEVNQSNFDILNWPYFHGGGQKARASLEMSSHRKIVDVSLTEPWFLDRRLSLMVEGYRRDLGYDEFDEVRTGGGAGITVPLAIGRLNLRANFEGVRLDDLQRGDFVLLDDPSTPYRFTDEERRYTHTPLRLTWLYDTRDRPFVPTRGSQVSVFGEISGKMLGGDNEIYTLGVQARRWFPLWAGHVLSLRLRAESVDCYGDQDTVHIGDRLFIGGGRTLRGFEYRDVGPKAVAKADAADGRRVEYHPIGGQTLAMASAEYAIPLFKLLRVAGFFDIGNVWRDSFDVDLGNLASSAGIGLRLDIPGFPIRLDYAWPIEFDDDFTDEQRWVIWIGYE